MFNTITSPIPVTDFTQFPAFSQFPAATSDSLNFLFNAVNGVSQLQPLGAGDDVIGNFLNNLNGIVDPVAGLDSLNSLGFDTTGFTSINDFALTVSSALGSTNNPAANQVFGLIDGFFTNGPNSSLNGLTNSIIAVNDITNDVFARGVLDLPFLG